MKRGGDTYVLCRLSTPLLAPRHCKANLGKVFLPLRLSFFLRSVFYVLLSCLSPHLLRLSLFLSQLPQGLSRLPLPVYSGDEAMGMVPARPVDIRGNSCLTHWKRRDWLVFAFVLRLELTRSGKYWPKEDWKMK